MTWEERFGELQKYKEEHGDCCVPRPEGAFGQWLRNQWVAHNFFQEGKESPLDQQKIDLLNNIGLIWTVYVTWEDRFG